MQDPEKAKIRFLRFKAKKEKEDPGYFYRKARKFYEKKKKKDPDFFTKKTRVYRENNREKCRLACRVSYSKNKYKINEYRRYVYYNITVPCRNLAGCVKKGG